MSRCIDQGALAITLDSIETPAVVVDRPQLARNIAGMQAIADRYGVGLRPHIKTHKCLEIAQMQRQAGAVGITASKTDEALLFIEAGFASITVAYPLIDPCKLDRLLAAARSHGTDLRVLADSRAGCKALAAAAERQHLRLGVFLKVDVGLHRCGLRESDPELIPLARSLHEAQWLDFRGLLSHAGHAYGAGSPGAVRAVAAEECAIMLRVRERLSTVGISVPEVSVGSTPTALASDTYEGITEMRPGTYVFLDRAGLRAGLIHPEDIALTVVATVVSRNTDYLIVDAGSKVLSSDSGAQGASSSGYGLAFPLDRYPRLDEALTVEKLSEEHGWVGRGPSQLNIGERVRIIPNHACPVANLADGFAVADGMEIAAWWPVAARGRVR